MLGLFLNFPAAVERTCFATFTTADEYTGRYTNDYEYKYQDLACKATFIFLYRAFFTSGEESQERKHEMCF